MKYIPNTPEGTRDRLFGECMERRIVQSQLTRVFRQRGYTEIMTPEMEYYDVFTLAGNNIPQENLTKVIDRSGKICVMRPDMTTPIARVAGTKLKDMVLPRRFFYNGTVYRSNTGNKGNSSVIPQCGIELIGAPGIRADLEVIAMAVQALEATGLTEFQIELGHAGYFTALTDALGADEQTAYAMRQAVENRSFAAFSDLLAPYGKTPAGAALKNLSRLFGGVEILGEARALTPLPQAVAALDYLAELYGELARAGLGRHVRFDLSLVQGIDYYTGVVFRGYARGAGTTVVSGGRYDGLVGRFGADVPATGFAVDVAALASCLPQKEVQPPETVIWYGRGRLGDALAAIAALPDGTGVLSAAASCEMAEQEARAHGAKTLLILDGSEERSVAL